MMYLLIFGGIALLSYVVQSNLQRNFKEYSKEYLSNGMTGREVAEKMLRDHGIYNVKVISTPGQLTDHYNPSNLTVNLSESVYNERSVAAAAVAAADWDAAGVAMRASHASLKNDFEVSCAEVDTVVSLADSIPSAASVYGARMTGGGFGGCIVALVKSDAVQQVAEEMIEAYRNALGIETDYLITRPGEGARVLYKA